MLLSTSADLHNPSLIIAKFLYITYYTDIVLTICILIGQEPAVNFGNPVNQQIS